MLYVILAKYVWLTDYVFMSFESLSVCVYNIPPPLDPGVHPHPSLLDYLLPSIPPLSLVSGWLVGVACMRTPVQLLHTRERGSGWGHAHSAGISNWERMMK